MILSVPTRSVTPQGENTMLIEARILEARLSV